MKHNSDISAEELEQIEQYLQGRLQPGEAAEFEARIKTDEALAEKVAEMRLTVLGIQEAVLSEKLQEYHQALDPRPVAKKKSGGIPLYARWALAASLLLLVSLGTWWLAQPSRSYKTVYTKYYKPDPGLMTVMSRETSNYTFEKAMVEYKNGEYRKALDIWLQQLKTAPHNDTLLYFSGAASQAAGDLPSAISYLQAIAADRNSAFRKDACWYLGLIYLRAGEKQKAIEYLQQSEYESSRQIIKDVTP